MLLNVPSIYIVSFVKHVIKNFKFVANENIIIFFISSFINKNGSSEVQWWAVYPGVQP